MQVLDDIFAIWGTPRTAIEQATGIGNAIGAKPDTVYRWMKNRRIPEEWWQPVIDAAVIRGRVLTAADLLAANKPPKLRGRPAHKVRPLKRRRVEARAG